MRRERFASPSRRRVRFAAVLSAAVLLSGLAPGLASGQEEEFVNGSGTALAQVMRVGPTAGRLSLAPIFGLSLSDYLSTVGRGQAAAADWAAIGIAEPSLPENTPSVKVSSTGDKTLVMQDEGSQCTHHDTSDTFSTRCFLLGASDADGNGGGLIDLFAKAAQTPSGTSTVNIASFTIPGLIDIGQGRAVTSSGVVDGKLRVSKATVDLSSLQFGPVTLEGLHWEALQQTGATDADKKVEGLFSLGGASIGGLPIGADTLEGVIGPINTALASTGFAIQLPEVTKLGDFARVTPLAIEIVDSSLGRQFLAPIVADLQPIRDPLIAALFTGPDAPLADASAAVLVADLTLGIATGSSQLHIEFGGANAFTEGERFVNPFLNAPPFLPSVGGAQTVFEPGTPGTTGTAGTTGTVQDTGELIALPGTAGGKTVPGDKGGVAVMVGLIGLLVAGALAAADWYRMRTARLAAGG